ncbi:hypothetical protein M8J75_007839 [Diaphorina citri]|nr:hypothetical protein M8J75_007839 [Diaphorina citri]
MELIDKQIWNGLSRTLNFSSSNQYDSFQYNQCCKVSSSALSNKYSTCFYRFLARFSGRRRRRRLTSSSHPPHKSVSPIRSIHSIVLPVLLVFYTLFATTQACSSRSTPKPRPPSPTPRPNITFHTYACPPTYATWYCLNGATCFTVKIGESLLYNCECADGYMGQRCEFKDLDGSYLPSRKQVMLETASIASGASIAVFLVVILCFSLYVHCQRRKKQAQAASVCCTDGPGSSLQRPRMPFERRPSPADFVLTRITTEAPRAADTRTSITITGKGDSVSASQLYHQSSPPLPHMSHPPSCTPLPPAPSQPPDDIKADMRSSQVSATLIV